MMNSENKAAKQDLFKQLEEFIATHFKTSCPVIGWHKSHYKNVYFVPHTWEFFGHLQRMVLRFCKQSEFASLFVDDLPPRVTNMSFIKQKTHHLREWAFPLRVGGANAHVPHMIKISSTNICAHYFGFYHHDRIIAMMRIRDKCFSPNEIQH